MPITGAMAVSFPQQQNTGQPLSKYGVIQNVQSYSTNPYWNKDSPYNMRMPVPIYAQGTDLTAADCQSVTASLVASECMSRNNCNGIRISDIRPNIMLRLSQMTGANYVGSCAGYIEPAFNNFIQQYGTTVNNTNFPRAINPGNNTTGEQYKIANPYKTEKPKFHNDPWLQDMIDRENELEALQKQNGAGSEKLVRADMPTTYDDLSFTERLENTRAGYESAQAAGLVNSAYKQINLKVETDAERRQRELEEAQHAQQMQMYQDQISMSEIAFCKKYPKHERCVQQSATGNTGATTNTGSYPSNGTNVTTDPQTGEVIIKL